MSSKTDQELIELLNKGKCPEFLKEIENLFKKPIIVIQNQPVQNGNENEKSTDISNEDQQTKTMNDDRT
jgi:hypothetical protein